MDVNQFVANFAAQFEETETSDFSIITKFHEIDEWNSLLALTIIAMVDDEYSVKITGEDVRSSQTIEDIYNIVKSKL